MVSLIRGLQRGFIWLMLTLGLILAGCGIPQSAMTSTPEAAVAAEPAETVVPTATAVPSATLTASATPTLTEIPFALNSATALLPAATETLIQPEPVHDSADKFEETTLLAVEAISSGYRITIRLPGASLGYDLTLNGNPYRCTLVSEYQDRLFCMGGAAVPSGKPLPAGFLLPGTEVEVWSGTLISLAAVTATPAGYTDTDCPSRGENASCETECRQLPGDTYCVVATCADACGLYFSVNTCPQNMSVNFSSCTADQWAEAKARYSLP